MAVYEEQCLKLACCKQGIRFVDRYCTILNCYIVIEVYSTFYRFDIVNFSGLIITYRLTIVNVAAMLMLSFRANVTPSKRNSSKRYRLTALQLYLKCSVLRFSVRRMMICLMKRRLSGTHTQSSVGCVTSNLNRMDKNPPST